MTRAASSTTPPPALVEAHGLGIRRDGRWLIQNVDLAVRPGEIVTLIGPNGGGKTTTARALLGLIAPDRGRVARRRALRVGYVPQRLAIDHTLPLSVSRLMTLTRPEPADRVREALARTGVSHLAGEPVQALSGGEFQRVLMARAIVGTPELLVLDEPVQGVDYAGEIALYELIRDLRDQIGCGILLISHDLHIVLAATDTVVCLDRHVCCSGTPQHVVSDAAYSQLFGRRGAAALAVYTHHHDHTHDAHGNVVRLDRTERQERGEPGA